MLTSRITLPAPASPDFIDIFSSSLSQLFTDDVQNSHGTPGSHVTYASPTFGDVRLRIPAHPDVEEGRSLFAHYLWNAGVVMAEGLERRYMSMSMSMSMSMRTRTRTRMSRSRSKSSSGGEYGAGKDADGGLAEETVAAGGGRGRGTGSVRETKQRQEDEAVEEDRWWDSNWWDVKDKRVLELGAGTALPSLISALAGASAVTITDHPSSPALTTNAIEENVKHTLYPEDSPARSTATIEICGYVWGERKMYSAAKYGEPIEMSENMRFDRIFIADCLWMRSQHENLVKTVEHFLDEGPECCAVVVAGFHTGRNVVASFFDIATAPKTKMTEENTSDGTEPAASIEDSRGQSEGGGLSVAEIIEVDVDGGTREWSVERPGETIDLAKRWCVCALLVKS